MNQPVVILGAGLAGLSTAWHLQAAGQPYRLLESRSVPGGYIRSVREGAYLRELGPNSLLLDDELRQFLDQLGLSTSLLPARPVGKARFIFRRGAYRKLPAGPLGLLFGNFFSWETKRAIFRERNLMSRSPEGETLAEFFTRRFSPEIVDYALDPFVGGIYAGDARQLLAATTFPALLGYERDYGSVLKGLLKNSGGKRRETVSFKNGLQTLTDELARQLTHFEPNTPVSLLEKVPGGWQIGTDEGTIFTQKLVVTAPAFVCAEWFRSSLPALSKALDAVQYPPMTVVHTAFNRSAVRHPLGGFGGLNPPVEGQFATGHLWSSSVFAHRCPPDEVLFTSFVGGSRTPQYARLPDTELLDRLGTELRAAFGISGEATFQRVFRWERAIPQYDAGALAAQQQAADYEAEGLFFATNWQNGVSLADGIKKGKSLAGKLVALR